MWKRRVRARPQGADGETEFVAIDTAELSGIFTAPTWLRDLGIMSWLLVGVAGMLVGAVWLLSLTQTIVIPVVTAAILASVLSPLVAAATAVTGTLASPDDLTPVA